MNLISFVGMLYFFCIAAFVGYTRQRIEQQKYLLAKLTSAYIHLRMERKRFESAHAMEYGAVDDPSYQELLRREAGSLIYIGIVFPKECTRYENQLEFLLDRISDSIVQ